MTNEEKKEFSGGVELSLDISNETIQNLKEALGINELEQIHKRFENGTETIEDIMYHCLNYELDLEKGKKLRLVETKYFEKLVKHIEKQSKEIEELNKSDASKEQSSMNYYNLYKELLVDIKAKIEELDKEEKEALKGTKGQDRYAIKQEYMYKRSGLQSLLEKE